MLNISSIEELLHKPSEIQWNITGAVPGKLKRKISCPLNSQNWEKLPFFIFWFKTNLTSASFLSLILNIFQGLSSEKTFCVQITIVPDIDEKKTKSKKQKNLKVHINFLLNA